MNRHDDQQTSPGRPGLQTDPVHGPTGDVPVSPNSPHDLETMPSDRPRRLARRDSDQIVKICKSCMVSQHSGGNYCVDCGQKLVPIRSVRDTCIGDVVGDKYTIVDQIGAGGMGEVYLGLNETIGQRVAIKFLSEKFTSDEKIILRFLNEARSYCMVNHPNAVTLLDYGQHDDGALYLITEYIEGQQLTELVQKDAPLPTDTVVSIVSQVCDVLSAAHCQGVIHRDLKPDNLMLIPGSRGQYAVKVLDFGIAKIADENVDGPMTETGSVFGTPEFMSPEQARGKGSDPRSDLYALGVILYYMTTGELPFTGDTKFATLNQQLHSEPTPPSQLVGQGNIHPRLEELTLRCLNKSIDDRPGDADEVAEVLQAIDTDSCTSSTTAGDAAFEESEKTSQLGDFELKLSEAETAAVQPLMATTFEDHTAETIGLQFDDELEATDLDVDTEFRDSENDETANWSGELAATDDKSEQTNPVLPSRPPHNHSGWFRSAAIGVVATLAVVGGVVLWTSPGEQSPVDVSSQQIVEDARAITVDGHHSAVLDASEQLLEAGKLKDLDVLLATLEDGDIGSAHRDSFDQLVRRASRARNAEMQLRSAADTHQCERSESLRQRLESLSPGAAQRHRTTIEECNRNGAVAVDQQLDDRSQKNEPAIDTQPADDSSARTDSESDDGSQQPSQPAEHPQPVVADADTIPPDTGDSTSEIDADSPDTTDDVEPRTAETESPDDSPDAEPTEEPVEAVGDARLTDTGASPGTGRADESDQQESTGESAHAEEASAPREIDDEKQESHSDSQPPADTESTGVSTTTGDEDENFDEREDVVLPPSEI